MESLQHNGILVVQPPEPRNLSIIVRGKRIQLNQLQEEMAFAWVRKLGTPYVEDPVFVKNFLLDFSKALNINPPLKPDEIDFSPIIEVVEAERAAKEAMTKDEKRIAREERKRQRELLKEQYGYAIVDGVRMELANYMTEPSGIFMGRGKHPLRGRWKQGARHEDIILNLSPDAKIPPGNWREIVWAPNCMWIAKWTDKLTGKTKYIWLHDSTPVKQKREAEKFDKALRLRTKIDIIRKHIREGLFSDDPKVREIAAACYLIDRLSLRVGDEKDPDEADTVGATTLRVEHLTFKKNGIEFDFLGKDSVPWRKELEMPTPILAVFKELYKNARERIDSFKERQRKSSRADPKKISQIFPHIRSSHVNQFLNQVVPGLTAKVFRTFHATTTMKEALQKSRVRKIDPDFIKKAAFKRANLEVARIMNHTKQSPKGWPKTEERYCLRLRKAQERITKSTLTLKIAKQKLTETRKQTKLQLKKKKEILEKQSDLVKKYKLAVTKYQNKRDIAKESLMRARTKLQAVKKRRRRTSKTKKELIAEARARVDKAERFLERAEEALVNARKRYEKSRQKLQEKKEAIKKFQKKSAERIQRAERRVQTAKERVEKAKLAKQKIETDFVLAKDCRTWNLGTSLKSYVHPMIIYNWCKKIDYDWRKVYPKTLQRKFAWVETESSFDLFQSDAK